MIISALVGGGLSSLGKWWLDRRKQDTEIDKDLEGRLREMLATERDHCEREMIALHVKIALQEKEIEWLKERLNIGK